MKLRILSGLIIGVIFIGSILWIPKLFYLVMSLVAIGMLIEWYNMARSSIWLSLLGLPIILIPVASLLAINYIDKTRSILLVYFVIIWSVDTFAMLGGRRIQGPKLAPKLSPNKTWSGLLTGIFSAAFMATLICKVLNLNIDSYYFSSAANIFMTSMIIAIIAQLSDLFVSYFKRKFGIKDTGHIIPGHGGLLDRFDSIIFTAPLFFMLVAY
jgi:phosphatidate cytidylyltransferase